MERLRISLVIVFVLALMPAISGCGDSDPDPSDLLDRVLTRENLASFGNGPAGPASGVVEVQALGFEDRVLEERQVVATPEVMSDIRAALGADSGLRGMLDDLRFEGSEQVAGVEADHISGSIEVSGLANALEEAGGGNLGALAGVEKDAGLGKTLSEATFDLYAGTEDQTIRRLDLTLALDDPGNALPPTRIRFSLMPVPSNANAS